MNDTINYKELFEKVVIEKEKLLYYVDELKKTHLTEINNYESKITSLTEHLKKYTAHQGSKKYYEKNKIQIIEKIKEYNKINKKNVDPEKIKEYNKNAYQKRKLKLQNNNLEN
jgi:hypothetical protein